MVSFFLAHLNWKLKSVSCLIRWHSAFVCSSVPSSVNFLHFRLFFQNHWANFNQTWHRASMGKGDSSSFNPFPKGDNYEIAKMYWRNLKIFPRTTWQISTNKLGTKHPLQKGKINFFIWRATPFSNWRLLRNSENTLTKFKNLLLQNQ